MSLARLLSKDEQEGIVRSRLNGALLIDLANQFDVRESTISTFLKKYSEKHGVVIKKPNRPKPKPKPKPREASQIPERMTLFNLSLLLPEVSKKALVCLQKIGVEQLMEEFADYKELLEDVCEFEKLKYENMLKRVRTKANNINASESRPLMHNIFKCFHYFFVACGQDVWTFEPSLDLLFSGKLAKKRAKLEEFLVEKERRREEAAYEQRMERIFIKELNMGMEPKIGSERTRRGVKNKQIDQAGPSEVPVKRARRGEALPSDVQILEPTGAMNPWPSDEVPHEPEQQPICSHARQETPRTTIPNHGVPPMYINTEWNNLEAEDFESVINEEEVTIQAFFSVLYYMGQKYSSENQFSILHPNFHIAREEAIKKGGSIPSIEDFIFFKSERKSLTIVPFLKNNHFFVLLVDYRISKMIYVDSLFLDLVEESSIVSTLQLLNDKSHLFPVEYAKKRDIYKQVDIISCAILTFYNIEEYVTKRQFNKYCNIKALRRKYYGYLCEQWKNVREIEQDQEEVVDIDQNSETNYIIVGEDPRAEDVDQDRDVWLEIENSSFDGNAQDQDLIEFSSPEASSTSDDGAGLEEKEDQPSSDVTSEADEAPEAHDQDITEFSSPEASSTSEDQTGFEGKDQPESDEATEARDQDITEFSILNEDQTPGSPEIGAVLEVNDDQDEENVPEAGNTSEDRTGLEEKDQPESDEAPEAHNQNLTKLLILKEDQTPSTSAFGAVSEVTEDFYPDVQEDVPEASRTSEDRSGLEEEEQPESDEAPEAQNQDLTELSILEEDETLGSSTGTVSEVSDDQEEEDVPEIICAASEDQGGLEEEDQPSSDVTAEADDVPEAHHQDIVKFWILKEKQTPSSSAIGAVSEMNDEEEEEASETSSASGYRADIEDEDQQESGEPPETRDQGIQIYPSSSEGTISEESHIDAAPNQDSLKDSAWNSEDNLAENMERMVLDQAPDSDVPQEVQPIKDTKKSREISSMSSFSKLVAHKLSSKPRQFIRRRLRSKSVGSSESSESGASLRKAESLVSINEIENYAVKKSGFNGKLLLNGRNIFNNNADKSAIFSILSSKMSHGAQAGNHEKLLKILKQASLIKFWGSEEQNGVGESISLVLDELEDFDSFVREKIDGLDEFFNNLQNLKATHNRNTHILIDCYVRTGRAWAAIIEDFMSTARRHLFNPIRVYQAEKDQNTEALKTSIEKTKIEFTSIFSNIFNAENLKSQLAEIAVLSKTAGQARIVNTCVALSVLAIERVRPSPDVADIIGERRWMKRLQDFDETVSLCTLSIADLYPSDLDGFSKKMGDEGFESSFFSNPSFNDRKNNSFMALYKGLLGKFAFLKKPDKKMLLFYKNQLALNLRNVCKGQLSLTQQDFEHTSDITKALLISAIASTRAPIFNITSCANELDDMYDELISLRPTAPIVQPSSNGYVIYGSDKILAFSVFGEREAPIDQLYKYLECEEQFDFGRVRVYKEPHGNFEVMISKKTGKVYTQIVDSNCQAKSDVFHFTTKQEFVRCGDLDWDEIYDNLLAPNFNFIREKLGVQPGAHVEYPFEIETFWDEETFDYVTIDKALKTSRCEYQTAINLRKRKRMDMEPRPDRPSSAPSCSMAQIVGAYAHIAGASKSDGEEEPDSDDEPIQNRRKVENQSELIPVIENIPYFPIRWPRDPSYGPKKWKINRGSPGLYDDDDDGFEDNEE